MDETETGGVARMLFRAAGLLLLLLWVASMSVADERLGSAVPLCFGLGAVLLLGIAAMVAGARPPRLTLAALLGVLAGLYFLARCVSGDALSEIYRELPLILAAFVFYGAGYLLEPRRGGMWLMNALMFGLLANMAYLWLMRQPDFPLEGSLRPAMTMAGANSRGAALFIYKNFAAIFLMLGGVVLMCRPLWVGWKGRGSLLVLLVGAAGVAASFCCESRSVFALVPLLAFGAWLLWVIARLYGNKSIGWGGVLTGAVLLLGGAVLAGDLLLGHSTLQKLLSLNTHLRTHVWSYIFNILPDVPWCGHGAGATQWQIVPFYDEWFAPNYAHNEYLQVWVDYGIVGLGLMVLVLGSHMAKGFWSMASEELKPGRRALLAACLLILLAMAGCAVFEFVWHSFALVALTAFACGVLASPVPRRAQPLFARRRRAQGSRPALVPVRFMGRGATACTCIGCLSLALTSGGFAWQLLPAWKAQWEYNALCHAGASEGERVAFLEKAAAFYTDPGLANHYVTLQPPSGRADDLPRMEQVLRAALASNPHHLFVVTMLVDVLGREGKFAEAESLMRDTYAPEGQDKSMLANWPGYYALNLLRWGCERMEAGDMAMALSLMEYALNMQSHGVQFHPVTANREGGNHGSWNRWHRVYSFVNTCRLDVELMHTIGVEKDDSWQQPMSPGAAPALYARWGKKKAGKKR